MRALATTILTVTITLLSLPAFAQIGGPSNDTFKASILEAACNPSKSIDKANRDMFAQTCEVYFRGLTDGLFLMKSFSDHGNAGCLPDQSPLSNEEAKGDFELFLRDHPESAENSAAIVAVAGIMRAHPCKK